MKKVTRILSLISALLIISSSFAQKVAIIGMNHISSGAPNDGFTFVATEFIPANEVIYFTENEYVAGANAFTFNGAPTGEAVVRYVVGAGGLSTGVVVFMHETSSNTFTITCSSGNCGTSTTSTSFGNGSFNLSTNGDGLYAYADTDENVLNGISQIYSVMFTGSGEAPSQNGGAIPAGANPIGDFPNAIVVDGFPDDGDDFAGPDRVEYGFNPASLRDGVSQTNLESQINYLSYASSQDLSIVPFTNLNLSGANPVLTVTSSPSSLLENSGSMFTYTFMLDALATSNITVNFVISGEASLSGDYVVAGATSFNTGTGIGTVTINSGTNSTAITISPLGDSTLEPDESVSLTLSSGTGYDAGSPSVATSTIINDDSQAVTPLVAITGVNHTTTVNEGLSFVALDDISSGTTVYFTDKSFDNTSLSFSAGETLFSWQAPGAGVLRGEVIVIKETSANVLGTPSCNNGTCGTVTLHSANFSFVDGGETFYAFSDTDSDPTNGITEIHAALYTGAGGSSGGTIPSIEDPSVVYTGTVVVDNFPATAPNRTEYKFASGERSISVDQANFQNTSNWLHAQSNQDLSIIPFSNITISTGSTNPIATVTVSPASVLEDSGIGLVYTFALNTPAVGAITVNFSVGGTATFSSDYTVAGANSFNASSGSVIIPDTASSASVTITPVVDSDVEVQETVELMLASGTGYDGGTPNDATGTITNDDTSLSDPLVAITGINHLDADGFSFVAAKTISAGTEIFFTDNEFDNTTLLFDAGGEGVLKWIAPAAGIPAGDVIVVKETASDVFSLTCNGTSGAACGTITLISGNLANATDGETMYAYEDDDNDPSNGVVDIYAVLFTGRGEIPVQNGGTIPAVEDPSGIYLSALVVDGFPTSAQPNRTEYKYASGERGILVEEADFEDVNNWLFAEANQDLSPIPFTMLSIIDTTPPTALCKNISVELNASGVVTITGAQVDNGSSDNIMVASLTVSPDTFDCTNVGTPVSVTLTVADAAGNTATCMADVTVVDNSPPVITCPADIIVSNDIGLCGATVNYSPDILENCPGTSVIMVPASGSFFPVGTTQVTATATDASGNTANCTFNVTVNDIDPPVITCPANIIVNNDPGLCGALVDYSPPISDNCPGISLSLSPASGSFFPVGTTQVTATATDASGNVAICTFDVTVNDTEPPIINCPLDIVVDNDLGVCGAIVSYNPSTSDNCPGVSLSLLPASGSIFPVGTTQVTATATDASGNVAICTFNVTVNDTELPTIVCPGNQIEVVNSSCEIVLPDYTGLAAAGDNCNPVSSIVQDPVPGTIISGNGTIQSVKLIAHDSSGNMNECTFDVTLLDSTAPFFDCPTNLVVNLDSSGNGILDISDYNLNESDNCSDVNNLNIDVSQTNFNCIDVVANSGAQVWINEIHYDNSGTDVGEFIEIAGTAGVDLANYQLAAYDSDDLMDDLETLFGVIPDLGNGIGVVVFTRSQLGSQFFENGPEEGRALVETGVGVVDFISYEGVVNAIDGPAAGLTSDNIGAETSGTPIGFSLQLIGSGNQATDFTWSVAPISATAGTTNSGQNFISVPSSGPMVNITVSDENGNAFTCLVEVTVLDLIPPTAVCVSSTIQLDAAGNATINVSDVDGGSTDNCGIASTSIDVSSFDCSNIGLNFVTLTVVDNSGNESSCVAEITVEDNINPIALCQSLTIALDANGNGSITPQQFDNGSYDICSSVELSLDQSNFDCSDVGATIFTDDLFISEYVEGTSNNKCVEIFNGSGVDVNLSDYSLMYYFNGNTSAGNTINLSGTIADGDVYVVCDDNAAIISGDLNAPGSFYNGDDAIALVHDGVPIDIFGMIGQDPGSFWTAGGNRTQNRTLVRKANIYKGNIDNATGFPSLGTEWIEYSQNDISNLGSHNYDDNGVLVTLTVTDASGNSSSCSSNVIVQDTTPPMALCQSLTLQLDATGNVNLTPEEVNSGSFDNCGIQSMSLNKTAFNCSDKGNNLVTLTVIDVNGNIASCDANILIEDTVLPNALCQNLIIEADANGNATIEVADINAGSNDNCDVISMTLSQYDFNCSNLGENTVTLTVVDESGNVASCDAEVTLLDVTPPTIICPGNINVTSDVGFCYGDIDLGIPITDDNCTVADVSNDAPANFPFGTTIVTWTVTDQSGNTASCEQEVIVNQIITITTVTATPNPQQYSDMVTFEATIEPGECINAGVAADRVKFYVGTQVMGTVVLSVVAGVQVGTLTVPLIEFPSYPSNGQMAPGDYIVTAEFIGVNPNFSVDDPTTDLTILQEDAIVDYTGQSLQATPSSSASEATVVLSANIQDITVSDFANDPDAGDIRNAVVKFVNRDTNTDISGWIPVVDLVDPADNRTGTVTFDWLVDIGNADSESHTVGILVDGGGYYYRDSSEDNTVVTVYKPTGDFITGGGHIIPDASDGVYASTSGLKTNFGFNVKYNRRGTKVKGKMNIIFRRLESDGIVHVYQIKSNAIQSLGVNIADEDNKVATFIAKSNLKDITDPLNVISLGGNLTLKADMTDRGEPGSDDSIAFNLTNNSNTLLYSSNWTGISTDELTLTGGNLVIHSGFSITRFNEFFEVDSWPNPSETIFYIKLNTSSDDMVDVVVFDINNRIVHSDKFDPKKIYEFGDNLQSGLYFVQVRQQNNIETVRLIKY